MKVVAFNGSARPNGNTHLALEIAGESLIQAGKENGLEIEYEIVDLAEKELNPCKACYRCKGQNACVQHDDMNDNFRKMMEADGIILASPTYFSNTTSRMHMLIERTGIMSKNNGGVFKGKIGASIAVARRQGANFVYSALNYFFGIAEMTIASSTYWNILIGRTPGEIKNDTEGIETIKTLGKNMANLLFKMQDLRQNFDS